MTENFSGWNFLRNIKTDASDIATGLNSLILGGIDNVQAITPWGTNEQRTNLNNTLSNIGNYFSGNNLGSVLNDVGNLILSPYNTQTSDFGTLPAKEILKNIGTGIYEHPAQVLMDALPIIPMSGKFAKAEGLLLNSKSKLYDTIKPMEKELQGILKSTNTEELTGLLRMAEEGIPVPKNLTEQFNALKKFSDSYSDALKKLVPEVEFNPKNFAVSQKIFRDVENGKLNLGNVNFADIEKMVNDVDILRKNNLLDTSTAQMKEFASEVDKARKLADEGKIFPITHFGLEAGGIGKTTSMRNLAPMARPRIYGNTKYEDIADLLTGDRDILPRYMYKQFGERLLGDSLMDSTYRNNNLSKNISLSRAELMNGNLTKEIKRAMKSKQSPIESLDTVLLDKDIAKDILKAVDKKGGQNIFEVLGRNSMLAQGSYLVGNALGQAVNTIPTMLRNAPRYLSEGLPTMDKLKESGLYINRGGKSTKPLGKVNDTLMQFLYETDRRMQNFSGAVSLDNELRKIGVNDLSKVSADDMIKIQQNVMADSLRRREIPMLGGDGIVPSVLKSFNPFLNWLQTASVSTIHQLRNNPALYNVLLSDVGANLMLNHEKMVNEGLGIENPKPFKKYELDNDGNIVERSVNFFAPMTPLQVLGGEGIDRGLQVPFWSEVINSINQRDKYGNLNRLPNTMIDRGVRYQVKEDGSIEQDKRYIGETVASIIRQSLAPTTFLNRTLLPLFGDYQQPYADSIFGNYVGTTPIPFLTSGNPKRVRTAENVQRAFSGEYQQDYYPERDIYPSTMKRLRRKQIRESSNDMQ